MELAPEMAIESETWTEFYQALPFCIGHDHHHGNPYHPLKLVSHRRLNASSETGQCTWPVSRARGGLSPTGFFHVFPGSAGCPFEDFEATATHVTMAGIVRSSPMRSFKEPLNKRSVVWRPPGSLRQYLRDIPGVNSWGLASNIRTESQVMVGWPHPINHVWP